MYAHTVFLAVLMLTIEVSSLSQPVIAPYFEPLPTDVTVNVGGTARLLCTVRDLGGWTGGLPRILGPEVNGVPIRGPPGPPGLPGPHGAMVLWYGNVQKEWYLNKHSILLTTDVLSVNGNGRLSVEHDNGGECNLIIKNVRPDDEGVYQCKSTAQDRNTRFVYLHVVQPEEN